MPPRRAMARAALDGTQACGGAARRPSRSAGPRAGVCVQWRRRVGGRCRAARVMLWRRGGSRSRPISGSGRLARVADA